MALSRVHVWIAGEVLTASDLNAEFNNVINNAASLFSPFTSNVSAGGFTLYFDAANSIGITAVANGISLAGGALNTPQGADVASSTTLNLDTATGNVVDVTGTTTITAITLSQGRWRLVRFTGALILTNGASLVLPGSANITTASGDYALFVGYASSVVRCAVFQPLAGYLKPSGGTLTGALLLAGANTLQAGSSLSASTTSGINFGKTSIASATSPDIFAAGVSNTIDYTGTVTCAGFTAAPQAGVTRTLICAGAAVFTAGANILIDGIASGSNFTAVAGDKIDVIAFTTTQFYLIPHRYTSFPVAMTRGSNTIGADVNLSNTGTYFDGPSVSVGTVGIWYVTGTVTCTDTSAAAAFNVKLWDGTTTVASGRVTSVAANANVCITLAGFFSSPAANIRMSANDASSVNGVIKFNASGQSADSQIWCLRVG